MTKTATTLEALAPAKGILLITNNQQPPSKGSGYEFAVALASTAQLPVTLYDRSEETWGDSQHPEGPLRADDARLEDRPELTRQVRWLDNEGVTGQGWVATLPSISAVLTALAQVEADIVVVPEQLDRNLFERMLSGGSIAESVAEQISGHPNIDALVVEVDVNGNAAIVEGS